MKSPIDLLAPERRLEVLAEAARALVVQHVAAGSTLGVFAKAMVQSPFDVVKLADLLFPVSRDRPGAPIVPVRRDRPGAPNVPVRLVVRGKAAAERPARRSPKKIAARCAAVFDFVRANPGSTCEVIKTKLGASGVDDALARLRTEKRVKTKGRARGTTYSAV